MKNLIIFLFGACVGSAGTFLWFHKGIKKELENIRISIDEGADEPFVVEEKGAQKQEETVKKESVTEYNKIINDVKAGVKPVVPIPVMPRDDAEEDGEFIEHDDTDGGIYEIDSDEFTNEKNYKKNHLVYYRGDRIMATEEGTKIANPFFLVGGEWENCVGNYAKNTAFIRNTRLKEVYEILVDDGLYSDEYGVDDNYRED